MTTLIPMTPELGADLLPWAGTHIGALRNQLRDTGMVWLRGFTANEPDLAQQLLDLLGADLMDDVFFSTPRRAVSDKTYTATEYPRDQRILLHSEMAYLKTYPRLLCFHALVCPDTGGQTVVGNLDAITANLGDLPAQFRDSGVLYRRVFHPGVDIPLAAAFGTDDPIEIAAIAARHHMTLQTEDDGDQRLTYTGPGALTDTVTGNPIWFNQAALHHPAQLPISVRSALTQMFGDDGLPRQAFYGDGTPISDTVIATISAAMDEHTEYIDWQPGDVVLLDNLRWTHGRAPYSGSRTLHVAMGMPCHDCAREPLFP